MSASRMLALCVVLAVCCVAMADMSILDEEMAPPPTSAEKLAARQQRVRGVSFVESNQQTAARELPFPLPFRAANRDNHLDWLQRESSFSTNPALDNTLDDYPRRPVIAKLRDGFRNKKSRPVKWRQTGSKGESHFWPIHYSGRWQQLKHNRAAGARLLREFNMVGTLKNAPPVDKEDLHAIAQTMSDAEHFRTEYHDDAEHNKNVRLLGFD